MAPSLDKNDESLAPYAEALGIVLADTDDRSATIRLPFRSENSNPGDALHGGCAASLAAFGARAVAAAALGPDAWPLHTATVQVSYLAAAIGEDVHATAGLLRRGKDLVFTDVKVENDAGKAIAHAVATVRARFGATIATRPQTTADDGAAEVGPMAQFIEQTPFIGARGIRVENMAAGRSRLTMPASSANLAEDGSIHEGALLALLDTAGAMAAWAETGPGPYKASTPSLQATVYGAEPGCDLVAFGRVTLRERDAFWCDVEVAQARDGALAARGTVFYRIVG